MMVVHHPRPYMVSRSKLSVWIAAFGLTISSATQLRIGDFPIGPGELILIAWAAWELGRIGKVRKSQLAGLNGRMLWFWALSLTASLIGWSVAIFCGKASGSPGHDLVAYVFTLVLLFVFFCSQTPESTRQVAVLFMSMTAVMLGSVLVAGLAFHSAGPIQPWYGTFSFCGWAKNPSQLTVQLTAMPFMALFVRKNESSRRRRAWLLAVAVATAVMGLWTLRDAIVVAYFCSVIMFVILNYYLNMTAGFKSRFQAGMHLVVPLLLVVLALMYGPLMHQAFEDQFAAMYDLGDQGSVRVVLWTNGLHAWALSPVVGLGPGSHSGLHGSLEDYESHNTLIDWATCAGAVGVALAFWLLWYLFREVWRARDAHLICGLLALLILSFFHYTFRQPNFWFTLVFISAFAGYRRQRVEEEGRDCRETRPREAAQV